MPLTSSRDIPEKSSVLTLDMPSTAGTLSSLLTQTRKRPAEMSTPPPSKLRVPRSTLINASKSITTLCFKHGSELAVYTERLRLSPFFETLLNRSNTSGRIHIPGSDPNLSLYNLKVYIHFLYTSNLATQMAGTEDDLAFLREECKLLGELYRLGVFVEDPRFRNAILEGILGISRLKGKDGLSHLPDPGTFSDLPRESPAKRCVMDLYVHFLDPDDPAIDLPQNQQFMREVFKASMRKSDVKVEHGHFRRQELRRCDYHEHPDGVNATVDTRNEFWCVERCCQE